MFENLSSSGEMQIKTTFRFYPTIGRGASIKKVNDKW